MWKGHRVPTEEREDPGTCHSFPVTPRFLHQQGTTGCVGLTDLPGLIRGEVSLGVTRVYSAPLKSLLPPKSSDGVSLTSHTLVVEDGEADSIPTVRLVPVIADPKRLGGPPGWVGGREGWERTGGGVSRRTSRCWDRRLRSFSSGRSGYRCRPTTSRSCLAWRRVGGHGSLHWSPSSGRPFPTGPDPCRRAVEGLPGRRKPRTKE